MHLTTHYEGFVAKPSLRRNESNVSKQLTHDGPEA
jgi:hypothetical protein